MGTETRLHKNEEQDMNNQCGYEQQKKDHASQSYECNTDYGPYLNPDVLENITKTTLGRYPQMRQTLRAVLRFFKCVVNKVPFPQIHIPELADVTDIHHLSVRKIINMKGKNSGAVIALKQYLMLRTGQKLGLALVAYGWVVWYLQDLLEKPQLIEPCFSIQFQFHFLRVTVRLQLRVKSRFKSLLKIYNFLAIFI